jgi:WD repeat-containing protein 44
MNQGGSSGSQLTNSISNSFHSDGNIIVTADYTGQIKVFRQDCAWAQRKADNSDAASIRVRGRTNVTRASSTSSRPAGLLSLKTSYGTSYGTGYGSSSRAASTRSSSRRNSIEVPSVPTNSSQNTLSKNLDVPKSSVINKNGGRSNSSPNQSQEGLSPSGRKYQAQHHLAPIITNSDNLTREKSSPQDRLMLQEDGNSLAFYHVRARRQSTFSERSRSISPDPPRPGSVSSGHSAEDLDDAGSYVDAEEQLSSDDMVCKTCGARTFNAFKVQSGPQKGETKLRCSL